MNHPATKIIFTGMTLGSTLAVNISWYANKSIPMACIHGFFSWGYVGYFAYKHPKIENQPKRLGIE